MANKSLTTLLQAKKAAGEKIFIPYIMAGADGLENLPAEIKMLADNGATAIEVGIPFSDPVADGPIIQQAGLDAFAHGVKFKAILKTLQEIKSTVPLILMGYTNSFFHFGIDRLLDELATTNVAGLIIPDLPYEHRDLIAPQLATTDISLIQLVTLTSTHERMKELMAVSEGFIYAVTINGTTGVGSTYRDTLDEHLRYIAKNSPIPVLAGFGVSNRDQVERFNADCDGAIVGSKIVATLKADGLNATGQLVAKLTGK
jgi:tryptophan synthase alpha chain